MARPCVTGPGWKCLGTCRLPGLSSLEGWHWRWREARWGVAPPFVAVPRPSRGPRTRCVAGRWQAAFARGRTPPPARRSAGLVPVRLAQRFAALGEGVEVGQEAGEAAQVLGVVLG